MKTKISKALPWILLLFALILLVFLNLFFQDYWLDSDMAAEMIFSRLVAEEGHFIASPNWYYSTEFRVLYTQLLMVPLFHVFNSWHVIRTVTNLVFYVGMLASYIYFVKPLKISRKLAVLTSLFLFLPFSETMLTHMQMGNTYMSHVIISFLFFGMFLRLVEKVKYNKIYGWVTVVCYILLSIICGVSGVRYLLALQCPLLLTSLIYLMKTQKFQDFRKTFDLKIFKEIFSAEEARYFEYSLLGAVSSVAGYGFNVLWVSRHYVFQTYDTTNFISIYQGVLFDRLQNAVGTLLMLFGYIPDRSLLSLRGVISILAFVLLGTIVYCVYRCLKTGKGMRLFVAMFLVTAFCLNMFVFVFTTSTMVPRYYITMLIFALPILAFYGESGAFKLDRLAVGAILSVCLIMGTGKIVYSFITTDKNEDKRQVAEFLDQNGYHFGFATYTNGNIVTELTDGTVEIANVGDPRYLDYFCWSSPVRYYQEGYYQGEIFLLLTTEEAADYAEAVPVQHGDVVYQDGAYVVLVYDNVEELMSYAEVRQ